MNKALKVSSASAIGIALSVKLFKKFFKKKKRDIPMFIGSSLSVPGSRQTKKD